VRTTFQSNAGERFERGIVSSRCAHRFGRIPSTSVKPYVFDAAG